MQLFNNDIRMKCEEILANLQEVSRRTSNREILYFLNEIQDRVVEAMYTSDEWFTTINLDHDKTNFLTQKVQNLSNTIRQYDDEIDDMEPGKSSRK